MAGFNDKDYAVRPEVWVITAGTIQSFTTFPGQISTTVKRRSGGSLSLVASPTFGIVNGGASLTTGASILSSGYLFETAEVMTIDGPARFFLGSTGSDTVVNIVRTFTQGFETVAITP